ncbi:hypothetical protein TNCV_433211 [Trichonephila clavipes]|nr:hypothetical protein TNCV_433211 [Trichonephila clavipes]
MEVRLIIDIFNLHQPPLHGGSSAIGGSNSRHAGPETITVTTKLPWSLFQGQIILSVPKPRRDKAKIPSYRPIDNGSFPKHFK